MYVKLNVYKILNVLSIFLVMDDEDWVIGNGFILVIVFVDVLVIVVV